MYMTIINSVYLRKGGAIRICYSMYFNFLNSKDSNGTPNSCVDNALLKIWIAYQSNSMYGMKLVA